MAVGDKSEDLVAPVLVAFDCARHLDGTTTRTNDQNRSIVQTFRADVAGDDTHHYFLEHQQQRRQNSEENEPGARELSQRQQVRERGQDGVADEDDADRGERLAQQRHGAVAVVAVVGEKQDRPEDQDDRIDLRVVAKGKEAGRELARRDLRQDEIADEERGKEGSRRERQVGNVDDPRDHARFFFKHSTSWPPGRSWNDSVECTALAPVRYTEIDR